MDFTIEVEKMPQPGETIIGNELILTPGGKGANQAYAIGKLGANVSILGAIGNDEYGIKLIENLNSVNVNTKNIQKINNTNTGCAFINVDKRGENNIVVVSGANRKITTNIIYDNINLIDEADIIVMQLEIPLEIVKLVTKIAKEKNKLVILDPAPAIQNLDSEILKNTDIVKPNETEIQILSGIETKTTEDIIKAAKILINKGTKNVIVTLGEKGSLLINEKKVEKFSALDVQTIDTTAAGDSFTAALAISLLEEKSIEEAIKYAHIVSSIVVTKKGAQASIPNKTEINNFIKERSKIYD